MEKLKGKALAPSILSADFARLAEEVGEAEKGGAGYIHVDVMDGHFVPNITLGPPVVKSLRKITELPLDVHLMIENPDRYISDFAKAGADLLAVHYEACTHLHRTLCRIREEGCCAGVALNPATPAESIKEVIPLLDFVVIMSVNPGFGGQKFIEESIDKIKRTRQMLDSSGSEAFIQVDGGVGPDNIAELARAGTALFVAGSAVFGADAPRRAAAELVEIINGNGD